MDTGCKVDVGDHVPTPADRRAPGVDWITGSALVPVRERLSDESWQQFRQELIPLLNDAYPPRPTVAPSFLPAAVRGRRS